MALISISTAVLGFLTGLLTFRVKQRWCPACGRTLRCPSCRIAGRSTR